MIDKTLRQIWIGGDMPLGISASAATWQERLPSDWQYQLLDEAGLVALLGEEVVSDVQSRFRRAVTRANAFRLLMLKEVGGWYADTDTALVDPEGLDSLPSADIVFAQWNSRHGRPGPWGGPALLDIYAMGGRAGAPIFDELVARLPTLENGAPAITTYMAGGTHHSSFAAIPDWHCHARPDPWAVHVSGLSNVSYGLSEEESDAVLSVVDGRRVIEFGGGAGSLRLADHTDHLTVLETSWRWARWLTAVLGGKAVVRKVPEPRGRMVRVLEENIRDEVAKGEVGVILVDTERGFRLDALIAVLDAVDREIPVMLHDTKRDDFDVGAIADAFGRNVVDVPSERGLVRLEQRPQAGPGLVGNGGRD